jgi:hypothetical protein
VIDVKKWYIAICAAFLIPLYALFFISIVDTDATRSESENRMLAAMPDFSFDTLWNGKYSEGFENYFSDTFPFREKLLGASKLINSFYTISLGNTAFIPVDKDNDWDNGQSIIDEIDDPWYTTSSETTTGTSSSETSESTTQGTTATETTPPVTSWVNYEHPGGTEPPNYSEVPIDDVPLDYGSILIVGNAAMEHYYGVDSSLVYYANAVSRVKQLMPEVNVFAMFCPTSIEFNAPPKYLSGIRSQLRAMNTAYSALSGVVPVNVWAELYEHRNEYVYFRTDHHWTQRGAYYGYVAFCKAAGIKYHDLSEYQTYTVPGFLGSMYTFTKKYPQSSVLKNNPDDVEVFLPVSPSTMKIYRGITLSEVREYPLILSEASAQKLSASAKYMMFIGGDNPIAHIVNNSVKNGRVLIVTKESYGNALVPFLTDHFEEIYVIDPREFNGENEPKLNLVDFANEHGATDILCVNYAFSATPNFMKIFNQMLP